MTVVVVDEQDVEVPVGEPGEIVVKSPYLSPGYWRQRAALQRSVFPRPTASAPSAPGILAAGPMASSITWASRMSRSKCEAIAWSLRKSRPRFWRFQPFAKPWSLAGTPRNRAMTQLLAYLTLRPNRSATPGDLRAALREKLPRQMIPSALIILDRFPINPHGKIDRTRLPPAPESQSANSPPQGPYEEALLEIWFSVLRRPINRDADFFDLGGDSLSAAVIAARIHARYKTPVDFRFFIDHPTLADQAAQIDRLAAQPAPPEMTIARVARDGPLPLSLAQESMFRQCARSSQAPFVPANVYHIHGPLRAELLQRCLHLLVERHEALRTKFPVLHGQPVQVTSGPPLLPVGETLRCRCLTSRTFLMPRIRAAAFFRQEAVRPFNLETPPLVRFFLVRFSANEHQFIRICHSYHLRCMVMAALFPAARGSSMNASLRPHSPPLLGPISFRHPPSNTPITRPGSVPTLQPQGETYRAQLDWWRSHLAGNVPAKLPFQRSRLHAKWLSLSAHAPSPPAVIWWGLPTDISEGLAQLAQGASVTPFAVRLGLFVALPVPFDRPTESACRRPDCQAVRILELPVHIRPLVNRIPLLFHTDDSTSPR